MTERLATLLAALQKQPLTLLEIARLLGISAKAAQSQMERYRKAGHFVSVRGFVGGKGICKYTVPGEIEAAVRAQNAIDRELAQKERDKVRNDRYRARLAGIDPDTADMLPFRRSVLRQWPPVEHPPGPVSVFAWRPAA